MPARFPTEKLNYIRKVMVMYGTSSSSEIHRHLKADGIKITRRHVHNLIQKIKESNEEWLDGQAKTTWAQNIRKLYEDKRERIEALKQERTECTQPRTKAYYAEVITATEASLIELMENQPLYYVWNKMQKRNNLGFQEGNSGVINGVINGVNDNAEKNAVIIRD